MSNFWKIITWYGRLDTIKHRLQHPMKCPCILGLNREIVHSPFQILVIWKQIVKPKKKKKTNEKFTETQTVKTYVFHMLRTHVLILCNWLILCQNALFLYLGKLRMCLTTSRNHVSRSSVKAFKSVQEIKQGVQNH